MNTIELTTTDNSIYPIAKKDTSTMPQIMTYYTNKGYSHVIKFYWYDPYTSILFSRFTN